MTTMAMQAILITKLNNYKSWKESPKIIFPDPMIFEFLLTITI